MPLFIIFCVFYTVQSNALSILTQNITPTACCIGQVSLYTYTRSVCTVGDAFVLTGIHAKPDDAVAEIGYLETVYYDAYNHWRIPVIVVCDT